MEKISKRKLESYKRAEMVCQELRYQLAMACREDFYSVSKYLLHWQKVTGEKARYKRPKKIK